MLSLLYWKPHLQQPTATALHHECDVAWHRMAPARHSELAHKSSKVSPDCLLYHPGRDSAATPSSHCSMHHPGEAAACHRRTASCRMQGVPAAALVRRPMAAKCLGTVQAPSPMDLAKQLTFPHKSVHTIDGKQLSSQEVIRLLEPHMTPERAAKMEAVAAKRIYTVVPVLENTYDMGNLAASCRSADAFGFGSVSYIKRSDDKYKQSMRTSAGAHKWLDVQLWDSTADCIAAIKAAGLQIVVTHLSKSSVTIQEIDFTKPTAIVLGNEKTGASEEMVAAADYCAIIPMAGFVESFNISVAGALVMYEAQQQRLRKGGSGQGDLTEQERLDLKAALMMRHVREPEQLITELLMRPPPQWQAPLFKTTQRKQAAKTSDQEAQVDEAAQAAQAA